MAGKNLSAQTEESKAISERIKMVRGIQRSILDPVMTLVQLLKWYDADKPMRADISVSETADILRLLVMGAHVELKSQLPGHIGGYSVPSDFLETIIREWMEDLNEAKGGEA